MAIHFIRHAKTHGNVNNVWVGRRDVPLISLNCEDLKKSSLELAKLNFDFIYCSPLIRAKQTANIISSLQEKKTEIVIKNELQERDFGIFEGLIKTSENIKILNNHSSVETISSMVNRLAPLFEALFNCNFNVLIVSHSAVYKCLVSAMNYQATTLNYNLKNSEWVQLEEKKLTFNK